MACNSLVSLSLPPFAKLLCLMLVSAPWVAALCEPRCITILGLNFQKCVFAYNCMCWFGLEKWLQLSAEVSQNVEHRVACELASQEWNQSNQLFCQGSAFWNFKEKEATTVMIHLSSLYSYEPDFALCASYQIQTPNLRADSIIIAKSSAYPEDLCSVGLSSRSGVWNCSPRVWFASLACTNFFHWHNAAVFCSQDKCL